MENIEILNNGLESAIERTLRGLWTINDKLPMRAITLICVVVAAIFITFAAIWGSKKQRGNMLIMVFGLAIFSICIVYGMILSLNDSIYIPVTPAPTQAPVPTSVPHTLPTPTKIPTEIPIPTETPTPAQIPMPTAIPAREITPTPTLTPTPITNTSFDNLFKKDYSKKYNVFSLFKLEDKAWGTLYIAEKTTAIVAVRVEQYSFEGDTLSIHTLKTRYNLPGVPIGEQLYTYNKYERYTETIAEDIFRGVHESILRIFFSTTRHSYTSRAYKLTVVQTRSKARKKIVEDLVTEDILSNVNNIIIDGIYFKKGGVIINVKQEQIDALFDIGNDPQIDQSKPNETINVFFEGEADYNDKIQILDDIKKYRQDKGLDPETGVNGIW